MPPFLMPTPFASTGSNWLDRDLWGLPRGVRPAPPQVLFREDEPKKPGTSTAVLELPRPSRVRVVARIKGYKRPVGLAIVPMPGDDTALPNHPVKEMYAAKCPSERLGLLGQLQMACAPMSAGCQHGAKTKFPVDVFGLIHDGKNWKRISLELVRQGPPGNWVLRSKEAAGEMVVELSSSSAAGE